MSVGRFVYVGFEAWTLQVAMKEWWGAVKAYRSNEVSSRGELASLSLKTTSFAAKIFSIGLRIRTSSSAESLTLEQKKELEKFQELIMKAEFMSKLSDFFAKAIQEMGNGQNSLRNRSIWIDATSLTTSWLGISGFISRETVALCDRTKYIVDHTTLEKGQSLYNFVTNSSYRAEVLDDMQDAYYFCYDYLAPPFYIKNIPLRLEDIEPNVKYAPIPQEHKANKIFRQFKCWITKKPIRYPTIIIAESGVPIEPIHFFERASLWGHLISNDVYPGTERQINVNDAKEHLGARKLIEDELKKLGIQ